MTRRFIIQLVASLAVALIASSDAAGSDCQEPKVLVGDVIRVSDGDTIWVRDKLEHRHKIRLNRIDAPESNQPFGKESTQHLQSLIGGREILVEYETTDRYRRILGIVHLGEMDINLQMVRDGYAWHYKHFDATPSYSTAESTAQSAKRGLWATTKPIPPHQWRRGNRKTACLEFSIQVPLTPSARPCGRGRLGGGWFSLNHPYIQTSQMNH